MLSLELSLSLSLSLELEDSDSLCDSFSLDSISSSQDTNTSASDKSNTINSIKNLLINFSLKDISAFIITHFLAHFNMATHFYLHFSSLASTLVTSILPCSLRLSDGNGSLLFFIRVSGGLPLAFVCMSEFVKNM